MLCKNCGTELNENAKFCNSCGAAVGTENVPEVSPVPAKNGSENWKGQEPFSGEPAAADETAQPGEAAPAEAIDAVEAAPAEAAPAAKKHNVLLYILIALAVIIVAVLIFRNPANTAGDSISSFLACEHEYVSSTTKKATCVSEGERTYTCKLCNHKYTEPIPKTNHSYTSNITKEATITETGVKTYTCSICGESYTQTIDKIKSDWEICYYVDAFGDATSDTYILGIFEGTFSNSATISSDLLVGVCLDNTTQIRLIEYGRNRVNVSSYETVTLQVKDSSGSISNYDLFYDSTDGDLISYDISLADAIRNNPSLSFVITVSSKYRSTPSVYYFKTNNVGLSELSDKA